MFSHRRIFLILILTPFLLLIPTHVSWAQEVPADEQRLESDEEMLRKAEENVQLIISKRFFEKHGGDLARKTEQQLKDILQLYPNTPLRDRVEENLVRVQEELATHELSVARFYQARYEHGEGGLKGAQNRLNEILKKYPKFSLMDEVLLRFGTLYLKSEQPDEAANFFWKLVCKYPSSQYVSEALEQLSKIGINTSEDCNNLRLK
ncbi:MAG: outer membrane protein assembly factor BamD [Acidobacteriota bacterium]|jgi:outer membrane protein assembly factor BamD (BamD/ComL family)|nr:outer membrane protein assembly factor BamD [Acidobacteriota bacterium]